jgi:hypothetical protein
MATYPVFSFDLVNAPGFPNVTQKFAEVRSVNSFQKEKTFDFTVREFFYDNSFEDYPIQHQTFRFRSPGIRFYEEDGAYVPPHLVARDYVQQQIVGIGRGGREYDIDRYADYVNDYTQRQQELLRRREEDRRRLDESRRQMMRQYDRHFHLITEPLAQPYPARNLYEMLAELERRTPLQPKKKGFFEKLKDFFTT